MFRTIKKQTHTSPMETTEFHAGLQQEVQHDFYVWVVASSCKSRQKYLHPVLEVDLCFLLQIS